MFAKRSPTLHLKKLLFKHLPSGRGRPPLILSLNSTRLAQPLRGMFFTQTLAAYSLDGTRYSKHNWQPRGTQLLMLVCI